MVVATGVWTGQELIIYGVHTGEGEEITSAIAYQPDARQWRRLASPPPRPSVEGSERAVWTGREMLVYGATTSLAYDPVTDRWRQLPRIPGASQFPAGPGGHVMVWTGSQLIVWGGGCCADAGNSGAAYTPATDSWTLLPASPLSERYAVGAWTGKELVIAGGSTAEGAALRDAAAYDPARHRWLKLPDLPEPRAADAALWDGNEVLLTGGYAGAGPSAPARQILAYDPGTGHWRRTAAAEIARTDSVAVWTGNRLLAWDGQTVRHGVRVHAPHGESYDPATDRWAAIPSAPLAGGRSEVVAVWTGRAMIVWGGMSTGNDPTRLYTDGAAYTP